MLMTWTARFRTQKQMGFGLLSRRIRSQRRFYHRYNTCPINPLHRHKFNVPSEYVGDIIYDPTFRSREYVYPTLQLFPTFSSLLIPLLSTVLLQHIQTDNTCSNSIPYSPSTELQPATNQDTSTTLPGTMPTSVPMVYI